MVLKSDRPAPEEGGQDYLLKGIPKNIYRHFAGLVKMKGKTVKHVLIKYMKDYS